MAPEPRLAFSPSLNQAVIARLPGLPSVIGGTRAVEWLSSAGIARQMAVRGLRGDLPPVPDGPGLEPFLASPPYPRRLDGLVAAGDPRAVALADELGTALAALLATLVLGPADARIARPEWPAEHWARWAAVRRVALGGGVVAGALGRRLLDTSRSRLPGFGAAELEVVIAPEPETLVLRGAAAALPDGPAVLLDAGHTSVKAALADVVGGRPQSLRLRPAIPSSSLVGLRAALLADRLAAVAFDAAGGELVAALGIALATYTDRHGQPFPGQASAFGSLAEVPLVARLEAWLRERTGRPVVVRSGGDGAAAASAVRGQADAALVLGTAIGWGLNDAAR